MQHDIESVAKNFQIFGEFVSAKPYGNGHIHDTYLATYRQGGTLLRYIHQRINEKVFKDAVSLMQNMERVTTHIRQKLDASGVPEPTRRVLTIVPTRDGAPCYRDGSGNLWRTFVFISKARTYDAPKSPMQAYESARAFGHFQKMLLDLPRPRLRETIPDFHNTPKRFEHLEKAIEADFCNRACSAKAEIEFALRHKDITGVLVDLQRKGEIPERITHNDTKFNNVMLDDATGHAICVIDLDTVMPGLVLYDFGDMVRSTTCPAKEDEKGLSKVKMQMPLFEALVHGYLSTAGEFLNKTEKRYLAFSGKLITLEIGIRFLTDYLSGDTYFKIAHKGHNLERCRTQFKLFESIMQQEDKMEKVVENA